MKFRLVIIMLANAPSPLVGIVVHIAIYTSGVSMSDS